MSKITSDTPVSHDPGATEWDAGGLRLSVSFRRADGATLRVFGPVDGSWTELLRFDDFIDQPHHHVPAMGEPIPFNRAALGEPLAWFVAQVRDHLGEMLVAGGFSDLLSDLDVAEAAAQADRIRQEMIDCVPEGYTRVPGVGLQLAA
jgi:hypothetical protein